MTLLEFQTIRDNNWGNTCPASPSTPLRDPVCDRTVFDALMAEIFSTEFHEQNGNSGNTICNPTVATGISYNLFFKKTGNSVWVSGYITNASGAAITPSVVLVAITNAEYQQRSGVGSGISWKYTSLPETNLNYGLNAGSEFKPVVSLPSGASLYLSGRYTVND